MIFQSIVVCKVMRNTITLKNLIPLISVPLGHVLQDKGVICFLGVVCLGHLMHIILEISKEKIHIA